MRWRDRGDGSKSNRRTNERVGNMRREKLDERDETRDQTESAAAAPLRINGKSAGNPHRFYCLELRLARAKRDAHNKDLLKAPGTLL